MNIETIHESLVNGQRKQMVEQIDEYGPEFWQDYRGFLVELYLGDDITVATGFGHYSQATISYHRIKSNR